MRLIMVTYIVTVQVNKLSSAGVKQIYAESFLHISYSPPPRPALETKILLINFLRTLKLGMF